MTSQLDLLYRFGDYGSKQFIDTWNKYVNKPLRDLFDYYGDFTPNSQKQADDQQWLRDHDLTGLYGNYLDSSTRKAQMQDQMNASKIQFSDIKYYWGSSLTNSTKNSGLFRGAYGQVSSNIGKLYK